MFDGLQERLTGVIDKLKGRGVLTEGDVDEALREVRLALLEAHHKLPAIVPSEHACSHRIGDIQLEQRLLELQVAPHAQDLGPRIILGIERGYLSE